MDKKQKKQEKKKNQKSAEKEGQNSRNEASGEVADNPLITGTMSAGQITDESGRKISLSEKKESDRVVVKQILKDVIREENKQSHLLL